MELRITFIFSARPARDARRNELGDTIGSNMYSRRDANKSRSKTVFSRLSPPEANHLKPLSIYSRMVTCDQKNSPSPPPGQFSDQFVNFQVKIVNNHEKKRKLGDSSLKSNPFKKPYALNTLSPDLGCYMDYSSPHVRSNSASPCTPSQFPLNENSPAWSDVRQTVSSQQELEFLACGRSKDPGDEVETLQLSPKSEANHGNISPSFDYDVDSILGLNPLKHGQEKGKKAKTALRAVEEDKGYVSSFHLNEEERNAEVSPEPQCHEQASFTKKDFSTPVSGPSLEPAKSAFDYLEGDDDVFIIGEPIFESSICQPKPSDTQSSQSKVQKKPVFVIEIHDSENSTVDLSWETTLPLQVQVKSKVVVPNQDAQSERSQRPKIYEDKAEWERLKRQYVFSVSSHLTENQEPATRGLMTELFDLMDHVAGQTGSAGSPWQHPSDLTCRNYQKRFGNEKPSMTLGEWKSKHLAGYKQFGNVFKTR